MSLTKKDLLRWIVSYIHLSCTLTTMALYLVLFVRTITHLMSWLSCRNKSFREKKEDKIIAVCADDPEYRHYNDIVELPSHRLAEIRRFFEDDKKNENKEVAVNEFLLAVEAIEVVKRSIPDAKREPAGLHAHTKTCNKWSILD
ncbi:hypothetical protein L1987_00636 [Smallanthus sonchifolius]|uniref:Uncharacterized protein n=1 Tax=Smallanthus sonchifolius TaxID=185202 RepID=A0ACB9K2T5_9ASTR|nr:hypothetical protein L1987_00636 [Smallanthus sonchifolius]